MWWREAPTEFEKVKTWSASICDAILLLAQPMLEKGGWYFDASYSLRGSLLSYSFSSIRY